MQRRVHRWSDLLLFGTIPTAFSLSLMKFNFIEDLLMKQFKLLGRHWPALWLLLQEKEMLFLIALAAVGAIAGGVGSGPDQ